jgi:serine/threonine protein kinase
MSASSLAIVEPRRDSKSDLRQTVLVNATNSTPQIADERKPRSLSRVLSQEGFGASTPPMRIASQSPARINNGLLQPDPNNNSKLDFEKVRKKAAKKKRQRAQKMGPAAPAAQIVRGFQTPITSAGEESDYSVASTPHLGPKMLASVTSSPAMRPSTPSGISALKQRLDALSIKTEFDCASPPSMRREFSSTGSDASVSDRTEMDTYEVPLDHDFVSPDVESKAITMLESIEGGLRHSSVHRKMTAGDFEPMKCLGKGAFGTVLLVKQSATGRLYAQKQFKKASLVVHKRLIEQTKTERHILETVNRHPFVVKLFYAFQDLEKLYLILEYAQGGELFHHLAMERMFTEETASFYMAEMVLALEHLHRNLGVVYRDLKPENCLLDSEGHLLLTDFGLSKVATDDADKCNSFLGTVDYMAPEIVAGKEYSFAVDWWSLGALGFDLLTGAPPFSGNNNAKIQQNILKCKLSFPFFLGPDAKDLLTRFLRKEPSKRLGTNMPKDMAAIKGHRFFKKIDWKKLAKRQLEPPIKPLITDPELAENFDTDFTDLAVSPVLAKKSLFADEDLAMADAPPDPFGGFSFVASKSLLDAEEFLL